MALTCLRIPKPTDIFTAVTKIKEKYLFSPMLKETECKGRDEEGGNRNSQSLSKAMTYDYLFSVPTRPGSTIILGFMKLL